MGGDVYVRPQTVQDYAAAKGERNMAEQVREPTLYVRLGGYDAITAVANDLLPRLTADAQLSRFWQIEEKMGCVVKNNC
jgi:hypothetical protein